MSDHIGAKKRSLKRFRILELARDKCVAHAVEAALFCMSCRQAVCMRCMQSETHADHSILAVNNAQRKLEEQGESLEAHLSRMRCTPSTQMEELATHGHQDTQLLQLVDSISHLQKELHRLVEVYAASLVSGALRLASLEKRQLDEQEFVLAESMRECQRA